MCSRCKHHFLGLTTYYTYHSVVKRPQVVEKRSLFRLQNGVCIVQDRTLIHCLFLNSDDGCKIHNLYSVFFKLMSQFL